MARMKSSKIKKKSRDIFRWAGKNWKVWAPISISGLALVVAIHANIISSRNTLVAYRLSKLDFRPIIRLDTLFRSAGKTPPHLTVTNIGSIDALQVKIQMYSHRFFPETGEIQVIVQDSTNNIFIEGIRPQESRAFKFNNTWLNVSARLETPVQNNVIEIRITYRRPQDLKEYDESAFYFVNPDGLWASEKDSSLNTEFYETIKVAVFGLTLKDAFIYNEWEGDRLHPK